MHEVKSRYLEPKLRRTTENDIEVPLKLRNRSSSGSSRASSPCVSSNRRKVGVILQNGRKSMIDSITISRDSLASPEKKYENSPRKVSSREQNDQLSVDSLGGSMRSSINSCNKTASQDSLIRKDSHKSPLACEKLHQPLKSMSANVIKKKSTQSPLVKSSTPSSIATLKSRLSINCNMSAPQDNSKTQRTTPANPAPSAVKLPTPKAQKSFLSARSRQILAQKKSLSHSDSSKSVPSVLKEKSAASALTFVNKSQSTSNILNRRPNPLSTTLHLRRSAKVSPPPLSIYTGTPATNTVQHSLMNPTKSSALKMVSQHNKLNRETSNGKETKMKALKKQDTVDLDVNCADVDDQRIESKLERSSTFCKERSEIPANELQTIDD